MEEMRVEDEAEKAEGRLSLLTLFSFRPLRWQLISIIVLMAGQQLSGVNAVRRAGRGQPGAQRWAGGPRRGDEPCRGAAAASGQGPCRTSGPLASPLMAIDPASTA